MSSVTVSQLLERNKAYTEKHSPMPNLPELTPPIRVAIVSCADPRVIPEQLFQLAPGEAIVFRNVAGHPHSAMSGILALDTLVGLEEIIILHHTDCGATYFTNDGVRSELKKRQPQDAAVDNTDFGAISTSLEENLRQDLSFLRSAPLMRKELGDKSRGFMYDIKTGRLSEV